jgi:hypothetical protein
VFSVSERRNPSDPAAIDTERDKSLGFKSHLA